MEVTSVPARMLVVLVLGIMIAKAAGQNAAGRHRHLNVTFQNFTAQLDDQIGLKQSLQGEVTSRHRVLAFKSDFTRLYLRGSISVPDDSSVFMDSSIKWYRFIKTEQNFYVRLHASAGEVVNQEIALDMRTAPAILLYRIVASPSTHASFFVPAGAFIADSPSLTNSEELPTIAVPPDSFCIGAQEISNAQYCEFLQSFNQNPAAAAAWIDWQSRYCRIKYRGAVFTVAPGFEKHPVVEVSWRGALAYCDWLSRTEQEQYGVIRKYRLPTEVEWQQAAHYGGAALLPSSNVDGVCGDLTVPVDSLEKSAFGLCHFAGNVREWCANLYENPARNGNKPVSAITDSTKEISIRGGSWNLSGKYAALHRRDGLQPHRHSFDIGFRVVLQH